MTALEKNNGATAFRGAENPMPAIGK